MTLGTGFRLGPYEILAPLGAGGMGEVYRARDTRLGRDVAIKVLPDEVATDPRALSRFEHEARAVAALSHPNILALFDVGESGGIHYAVTELLQGQTLRLALSDGPFPVRRALDIAVQIAEALAAAHENGIVHRDLKPENVFVGGDGHVKLLDFGLARQDAPRRDPSDTRSPTVTDVSRPGSVTGTVAYMSPEQAKGNPVDYRSDQFSLGIVLYEMLAGRRPFHGDSAAETLTAIIREEPETLERVAPSTPAPVRFLVERLLTKEPEGRYDSTRDLARELTTWRVHISEGISGVAARPGPAEPVSKISARRRLAVAAFGMALLAACTVGVFAWGKQAGRAPVPSFKRITLRRGIVNSARFTPDFQSVVYGAAWEGKPAELFVQRLASADARPLGAIDHAIGIAGTAGADVAFLRGDGSISNTLTRLPLEGGTLRDLLKDVRYADWDRSGTRFAIVRNIGGRSRLEYPVGKLLFESAPIEEIANLRLSPDGTRLAFILNPNASQDSGDLCVVDSSGERRTLSKGWLGIGGYAAGIAWSPDGNEVWFSASRTGGMELHAVTLSGNERLVARMPGALVLHDIAPDGRVLVSFGQRGRLELRGRMARDAGERDLSWLDGSFTPVLAENGEQMLFQEYGEGGGLESSTYHWRMDGSMPKRLGDGTPVGVSPDWTTALIDVGVGEKIELKLVPIGAGETVTLPRGPIHRYLWAWWHPDGKRIVIRGSDADGQMRFFVQDVAGGLPRPFTSGGTLGAGFTPFSADGRFIATRPKPGAPAALYPIDGGEVRPIPFLKTDDYPVVFGDDGRSLYVADTKSVEGRLPVHVVRLDMTTGRRDPWLELVPPDRAGLIFSYGPWLTSNGRFYAYVCERKLSDLYLVEGLR